MIFCLSQLHTGTQTSIAWLCKAVEVSGLVLSTGVYDVLKGGPYDIAHEWESGELLESHHPDMVYHEHVRGDWQFPGRMSRTQLMMATTNRTLIPIRDPLACLISYWHRGELNGTIGTTQFRPQIDVLDRWSMMSEWYPVLRKSEGLEFVCWDQPRAKSSDYLRGICAKLGLRSYPDGPGDWTEIQNNDNGPYDLKIAYHNRDLKMIRETMHPMFDALVLHHRNLRPMLEDLGYSDLLWWDR